MSDHLWQGLSKAGRAALSTRDYKAGSLAEQLSGTGVEARQLVGEARKELSEVWVPGVEIFARTIYPQRHRGSFGEFAREGQGRLGEIGFWPKQWSAARMFAQTAKGFHVHPPSVPASTKAEEWFRRLFVDEPQNFEQRRYGEEQWDVMFIVQGVVEMFLRDLREGMPARTMRFLIDGDNHRSASNVALVIPPGVAHALRVEGSEDVLMVYGTSTTFRPEFEGRIAAEIETATLPPGWEKFLQT